MKKITLLFLSILTLTFIKGYAKGYITEMECNEMMDTIQFEEYQS